MASESLPHFIGADELYEQFVDLKRTHIHWNVKRCATELQVGYPHLAKVIYLKQRAHVLTPHKPQAIPYYLQDYHKLKEVRVSCSFGPIETYLIQQYVDLQLYIFKNDVIKNALYEFFDHENQYLIFLKELNLCPTGKI